MSTISLRTYIHEIDSMIDQGRLDEAIAHARHILSKFPKHIETYRLLGKAYLESNPETREKRNLIERLAIVCNPKRRNGRR